MPFVSLSDDQIKAVRQLCAALDNDACALMRDILNAAFDRGKLRTDQKLTSQEDARTRAAPLFSKDGFHVDLRLHGSIGATSCKLLATDFNLNPLSVDGTPSLARRW